MTDPILGVMLNALGGLAAGSFYTPLHRVKGWAWESSWLVLGLVAWIAMPWLAAWVVTPDLLGALAASPARSLLLAFLYGALWGIGGLTFGLSVRYLGMSLGFALALGLCAAVGTLVPPIQQQRLHEVLATLGGRTILAGVGVCLLGIAVCGYAGIRKERELTDEQKRAGVKEFSLPKGFAAALLAGALSACMTFGIQAGQAIADAAQAAGAPELYKNNAVFILVMGGGFVTNAAWCLFLNLKNRSLPDYMAGSPGHLAGNYFFAGAGGAIWYCQFLFHGMGRTKMGDYDFASWTLLMAFIIVFSTVWGLVFHEWKGVSRRTMLVLWSGLGVLVLSTVIIGWGNALGSGL